MFKRWLLILAAAFSFGLSAYAQDTYIVVNQRLFSGRPDPDAVINDEVDFETLQMKLQNLPSTSDPGWGYLTSKGYEMYNYGVSGIPPYVIVFNGVIQEETADDQILYFLDVNGLEDFLKTFFPPVTLIKKTPDSVEAPSGTWLNIIGIFLPTNGFEPPYDPDFWNKNKDDRRCNNCYNYAVNVKNWRFAQPGDAGKRPITETKCPDVLAAAIADGMVPWVADVPCSNYDYKIALVTGLDPDDMMRDYHWYRQNPDGTWSHKRGGSPAKNTDESVPPKPITDPRTANRAFYTDFCGFMCVISDSSRVNVDGPGKKNCPNPPN